MDLSNRLTRLFVNHLALARHYRGLLEDRQIDLATPWKVRFAAGTPPQVTLVRDQEPSRKSNHVKLPLKAAGQAIIQGVHDIVATLIEAAPYFAHDRHVFEIEISRDLSKLHVLINGTGTHFAMISPERCGENLAIIARGLVDISPGEKIYMIKVGSYLPTHRKRPCSSTGYSSPRKIPPAFSQAGPGP